MRKLVIVVSAALVGGTLSLGLGSAASAGDPPTGLTVSSPVATGATPRLDGLPGSAFQANGAQVRAEDEGDGSLIHPVGDGSFQGVDPAVQSSSGGSGLPPTNHNFDGQTIGDNNPYLLAGAPPDTNGDVGVNDYVQTVNQAFSVYDKRTGKRRFGPIPIWSIWQQSPDAAEFNCTASNAGDPVTQFDPMANRWLITQFGFSETTLLTGQPVGPFDECVAVSQTSDPAGAYYIYDFHISYTTFEDYPKVSVWPDGYYVSFNQFNGVTLEFQSAAACALEREKMLAGDTSARMVCIDESAFDPGADSGNYQYGGQLPADLDGVGVGASFSGAPAAGEPDAFMQFQDSTTAGADKLLLWRFHVDWADTNNSYFGSDAANHGTPVEIPVTDFSSNLCNYGNTRACLPQAEGSDADKLDSIPDRLMNRLAYRNFGDHESLVLNHTVQVGDQFDKDGNLLPHAGVRWYEVRDPAGTPTVQQQGTYSPDGEHRWMGSLAMDRLGDIGMGYSLTSASRNPAIAYTARKAGDAPGTMTLGEQLLYQGAGSQIDTGNRWGDYSSMSVDPNGCDFWFTTEYSPATGSFNWATRIGSFTLPGCGDPQVSVASSVPQVRVGKDYHYTIGVTSGENGASAVTVQDVLPSGVTLLGATSTAGSCSGTTSLTCALGNLPAGDYESIDVLVHSARTGSVENDVTLTTTNPSDDTSNNTAATWTEVYSPCVPPGAVVSRDATGDALTDTSEQDLQSVAVAEPAAAVNGKLVFTIKVADLTVAPPNTTWYEHFSYGGVQYFVSMDTTLTPIPAFSYGWVHPDATTGLNLYDEIDPADAGSYAPDGTITITLATSKLDLKPYDPATDTIAHGAPTPTAGSVFNAVHGEVTALIGAAGTGLLATTDSTANGDYTLVGPAFCTPNAAPTATVTATPTSGTAPLDVSFDASASSDPDGTDHVSSYTFHFGDGSPPVTSSTPVASHTYTTPGSYRAAVTVTDSRGLDSANVATATITVSAPPPPDSADLGITLTAPSTARKGQQVTYTITVTNAGPAAAAGVSVQDVLPTNAKLKSVTTQQGTCTSGRSQPVTCDIGTMAAGASTQVTIVVQVGSPGDYVDRASVSATAPNDPVSGNNTATAHTTVR